MSRFRGCTVAAAVELAEAAMETAAPTENSASVAEHRDCSEGGYQETASSCTENSESGRGVPFRAHKVPSLQRRDTSPFSFS